MILLIYLKIVFIVNAYLKKGQEQTFELKEENEIIYDDEIFKYTIWNVNRINRRDFMEDKVYAEYVYDIAIKKLKSLKSAINNPEYYEMYLYELSQKNDFFKDKHPDEVLLIYKNEYPIKRLKSEVKTLTAIIKRSNSFLKKNKKKISVA